VRSERHDWFFLFFSSFFPADFLQFFGAVFFRALRLVGASAKRTHHRLCAAKNSFFPLRLSAQL
jgi:hypothetical protein